MTVRSNTPPGARALSAKSRRASMRCATLDDAAATEGADEGGGGAACSSTVRE